MKKVLFFLLGGLCYGQNTGTNVVNQIVQTSTAILAGTHTYKVAGNWVQNIGQSSHAIITTFSQATFITNGDLTITGSMFGSADCNSQHVYTLGPGLKSVNVPDSSTQIIGVFSIYGYGSAACLEPSITITAINGATGLFNINYVGNSSPSNVVIDETYKTVPILVSSSKLTVDNAFHSLIGSWPSTQASTLGIYGFALDTDSTATEFLLGCSTNGTTVSKGLVDIRNFNKGSTIWPISIRNYSGCNFSEGSFLIYKIDGVTATLNLWYRIE